MERNKLKLISFTAFSRAQRGMFLGGSILARLMLNIFINHLFMLIEKGKSVNLRMIFHRFLTADGKLEIVCRRFINAINQNVKYRSVWVYGCVAISNNFTLGSGIKQYASTNSG